MGKVVRITLTHSIEGSFVISEPEGWKDATLNWERHPDLHCVPETYKAAFSAYGSNGFDDGGRDWIKNIEALYGIDAIITSLVEEAEEFSPFVTLSTGTLPIRILIETIDIDHRLQFDLSPASFWTTFLSKFETPVNIQSANDLYGNACTVLTPIDLTLTSQKIRVVFDAIQTFGLRIGGDYGTSITYPFGCDRWPAGSYNNSQYIQLECDKVLSDEITKSFPLYNAVVDTRPSPRWVIEYSGSYVFDLFVGMSYYRPLFPTVDWQNTSSKITWVVQINDLEPRLFAANDFIDGSNQEWTNYDFNDTLNLNINDVIRVYGKINQNPIDPLDYLIIWGPEHLQGLQDCDGSHFFDALTDGPSFNITADTIYRDTNSPAFLIHDLGAAIVERIVGQPNSFKSNYLGRTNTLARTYPVNGCGSTNIAVKGIQLRGYTLTEKPFAESMKDYLLEGIKPIFNLGARYIKTDTEEYIQVEPSKEFYPDRVSITLDNVRKITRAYDVNGFYNQIKVGYEKYEIEEASGLNIPQSYRTLATILKSVGGILEIMSSYIAGDLTIERTRRTTREKSADYQYDNDVFIIAVRDTGTGFTPELSENYSSVTGLLNESTRYNKNLTPYRNLVRWLNVASNGLQSYLSSKFKFLDGTANYDMASTRNDGGCDGDFGGAGLSEKQDLDVSTEFLYLPILYTIDHYITSDQIQALRADPEAAINVSQTETGHIKFYIKTAEARPHDGHFTLVGWPKEFFDIKNVENNDVEQENPNPPQTFVFDDTFPKPPFN
jgi:hypothetical protein